MLPTSHEVSGAQRLSAELRINHTSQRNPVGSSCAAWPLNPVDIAHITVARGHGEGSNIACEVLFDHKFKLNFYPSSPRNIISIYGPHQVSAVLEC
jgi:hypothetical protein